MLFPAAQAVAVAGWQQVEWTAGISTCPSGDVVVVLCCAVLAVLCLVVQRYFSQLASRTLFA